MGISTPLLFEFVDFINTDYTIALSYAFVDVFFIAFSFQFAFAAVAVRDRMVLLNEKTKNLANFDESKAYIIIDLYEKLFDLLDDINSNFSLQLIFMFGYILPSTMFSFYSILRLILKNAYMKNLLILTNAVWIVAHSFIVGVSVYAGHSSTEN
jgi:hypothetical protein